LVAKDFAEWADLYTIDAVALHPTGDKVEGRAALERWASPGTALEYQARATEIEGRADLAYLRGSFSMRVTVTNRPVLEQGEFIQIWRKQSDGEWKVTHEMFTSDLLKWPS
jgi:ketosteroid isomerase-like protein